MLKATVVPACAAVSSEAPRLSANTVLKLFCAERSRLPMQHRLPVHFGCDPVQRLFVEVAALATAITHCALQCIRAAATTKDEDIKSMQDYQKGLQQRLKDHEQELKAGKGRAASAGGSSKPCSS